MTHEASINSPDGRRIVAEVRLGDDTIIGTVTSERSVTIPGWIFSHSQLSDRAVRLWGYMKGALIGSFAIPGTSHRSLALLLDVSPRSAREAIYELRDAGALTIVPTFENGRQTRNTYYLWPAVPAGVASGEVATDCQGGSILPAVYNTNNSIKDTTQNSVKPAKARRSPSYSEEFDSIWKVYPRRVNKAGTYGSFKATMRRGVSFDDLMTATVAYAASRIGQDEKFTMHGSTFFGSAERWRDYLPNAGLKDEVGPEGDELTAAVIYDLYDETGSWTDWESGEPVAMVDNPAKHGYNRPRNKNGQLVDASGTPYVLDAQGVRRPVEYWN
jgi:hypothetical protein